MQKATFDDLPKVAAILTESFEGNKATELSVGKSPHRRKILVEYCIQYCLVNGEIFINTEKTACALVRYSDRQAQPLALLRAELRLALLGIGPARILRTLRRETLVKNHQPKVPFIHLWFIGVAPQVQGRGEGSQMLRELSEYAAKKNLPICLETSTERNLPLYERLGFKPYHRSQRFGFATHNFRWDSL